MFIKLFSALSSSSSFFFLYYFKKLIKIQKKSYIYKIQSCYIK